MKLSGLSLDEARVELLLAKASYCDFMRAYCEAIELKASIDRALMTGSKIDVEEVSKMKRLTKIAEKCLKEAVMRIEKLRALVADDEAMTTAIADLVKMIGKKVEGFRSFKEDLELY